ncbi:hypothetical protein PSV08DRAFT_243330 [Bipolaris maydis]|uniref:uncharacterized protein n=1 Tax=Cochliobolus heterostrophus TaxID=5016 RepID=UPI0024D4CD49|nr:hypothetical protein J3E73DRAFT_254007 [Bipolaris maydis]KAJ6274244.1 hypothetical protein PSV08DRAFT_243330 [Bipolaris maydis]KAJ6286475.1 hypothetical protein J3E71DRAFT_237323 [Bipolaris maydis]
MHLPAIAVLYASLLALCVAVPADNKAQLEPRQTYIITCIGGRCSDNISRPTSEPSKPTSSKATTTTKVTTTSKKPEPTPTPTKTTIKTSTKTVVPPTKTTTEEVGPSSTRCPVPLYYKCGGWHDEWYFQCVADTSAE